MAKDKGEWHTDYDAKGNKIGWGHSGHTKAGKAGDVERKGGDHPQGKTGAKRGEPRYGDVTDKGLKHRDGGKK